ncbi:esterase/lipase family protein [Thalassotalea piscium]|uniref:Alpha/beta hydrolase n=1 Tax=Thalassotalea piscium TaxID=1230533 RepID=A0A7X0NJ34_9GAMM|nr:alpha/beta hydrolase [Thalassotalea piscium]MBB6544392.1 hypothetical protein [Thalassotalea piscium]
MRTITLFCFLALLASCSSSRFVEYQNSNEIIGKGGNVQLVDLAAFSTQEVHTYCLSLPKLTDVGLGQLIHCTKTLLGRNNLSSNLRNYAISNYNYAIYHLLKNGNDGASSEGRVTLIHSNLNHFIFSEEMLAKDPSLQPKIFGELGIPVVFSRDNQQVGLDRYAPLEGVMKDATLIVSDIKIRKKRFEVMLDLQFYSNHSNLMIGTNQYLLRHSPGAAYLALIEKADIDDYNWLGFVSPKQAEKRRGVFAIGGIFKDKIPLIMIHGLNSDPLIWRHLTMAILNEPSLMSRYQIWHIYYPSGPPPFYTASKTRDNLHSLLTEIGSNNLKEEAVIIGHSMGGVIAKLLAVKTDFSLWNTAFNQSPEHLLTENDVSLKNIFIFDPVFNLNTVFS